MYNTGKVTGCINPPCPVLGSTTGWGQTKPSLKQGKDSLSYPTAVFGIKQGTLGPQFLSTADLYHSKKLFYLVPILPSVLS